MLELVVDNRLNGRVGRWGTPGERVLETEARLCSRATFKTRDPASAQREGHVVPGGQVRPQRVLEAELELEEELDEHAVSASAHVPASTAIRRMLMRRSERVMAQSVTRASVRRLSRS
jgi:hypothetical protein